MGIGGISLWQLLIVLAIVVLLFGTKKLKGMGSDLGDAVKGFKKAIKSDTDETLDELDKAKDKQAVSAEKTNATEEKK